MGLKIIIEFNYDLITLGFVYRLGNLDINGFVYRLGDIVFVYGLGNVDVDG